MNLDNQTILIMGAAGRLGQVIAQEVLNNGGNVIAVDQDTPSFEEFKSQHRQKKQMIYVNGDITQVTSIQMAIEAAARQFGKIDGAVNTAYPRNSNYGRDFLEVTHDDFSENVSLHLGGYFLFMQQCVKYALKEKMKFSLVNLSSIYGSIAPRFSIYSDTKMTMPVEYAAIKSGLQHLVKYVTAYTKGSKFRVNCVSPGGILAGQDERFLSRYDSHCREKGLLEPKDIVGSIIFLLSDASEFICGQNIIVDDGFHV